MYWISNNSQWIDAVGSGAGGTLGVTIPVTQTFSCSDRRIVDADILINGFVDFGWSENDLFSTILHEMGHAIGLGHPCLTAQAFCSNSCTAVMAATAGDYPSLRQDDINAVSELYPGVAGGVGSACSSGAQCNSGICIEDDGISYCTQLCGTCPEGYVQFLTIICTRAIVVIICPISIKVNIQHDTNFTIQSHVQSLV